MTGIHHYYFKMYALNDTLGLPYDTPKEKVLDAINGKILDYAELVGIYKK